PDGGGVLGRGPRPAAAREMRLRPEAAPQPRQGLPAAPPLRRARPHAHPPRRHALPRPAAVLRMASPVLSSRTLGEPENREVLGREPYDPGPMNTGACPRGLPCSWVPALALSRSAGMTR